MRLKNGLKVKVNKPRMGGVKYSVNQEVFVEFFGERCHVFAGKGGK